MCCSATKQIDRKVEEIGRWSILSEEAKRDIVKTSWQRAKDMGKLID